MSDFLTPTEMAREFQMARRDVILRCQELGIPIYQGRIDRRIFRLCLKATPRPIEKADRDRLSGPYWLG